MSPQNRLMQSAMIRQIGTDAHCLKMNQISPRAWEKKLNRTTSEPSLSYSVVIPVFNSSGSLPALVERICRLFLSIDESFEILMVNDGSTNPELAPVLLQLANNHPELRIIELTRNFGQSAATLCGIKFSQGRHVITMDDDLQHLPEELPKLLALKEHDIVFAHFDLPQKNLIRRSGASVKSCLDSILFKKPKQIQFSSYRLISRPVAQHLAACSMPNPYIPALLTQASTDFVSVAVIHGKRPQGSSTYSLLKLLSIFGAMLFNNSSLPLRIISILGVSYSGLSVIATVILVLRKCIAHVGVTGWTSLIISMFFIGGMLMLSLGVVCEYLVRAIAGIEKRPLYLVRKTYGYENDD